MDVLRHLDGHDKPARQQAVHDLQTELLQAADVDLSGLPDTAQLVREAQPPAGLGQDYRRVGLLLLPLLSSHTTAGEPEVPDAVHGVLGQGEGDGGPGCVVGVLQDGLLAAQQVGQVLQARVVLHQYPRTGDARTGRQHY